MDTIARFAQKYLGPGIMGFGPDRHLRREISASSAPSVPRSLHAFIRYKLNLGADDSPHRSVSRHQRSSGMDRGPNRPLNQTLLCQLVEPRGFRVWMQEDWSQTNRTTPPFVKARVPVEKLPTMYVNIDKSRNNSQVPEVNGLGI